MLTLTGTSAKELLKGLVHLLRIWGILEEELDNKLRRLRVREHNQVKRKRKVLLRL